MSIEDHEIEIYHVGSPIIRAHAQRVSVAQGKKTCELLTKKLDELQGAGLAAPQIGLPYRVFVIEIHRNEMFPDRPESPLYTVINPTVEFIGSEEDIDYEGCFSVPGFAGIVPRYRKLRMRWTDPDGSERDEIFSDYLARVVQHEFDHLNGLLYIDRMTDMKSFSTRENYMRSRMESQCLTMKKVEENQV